MKLNFYFSPCTKSIQNGSKALKSETQKPRKHREYPSGYWHGQGCID